MYPNACITFGHLDDSRVMCRKTPDSQHLPLPPLLPTIVMDAEWTVLRQPDVYPDVCSARDHLECPHDRIVSVVLWDHDEELTM